MRARIAKHRRLPSDIERANGSFVPIVLQNDFEHVGAKY